MLNANQINREQFIDTWNEILATIESIDSSKEALKSLKSELGSIIGADSQKDTNAVIKALLKKVKDDEFFDGDTVSTAEELYDEIISSY